MSSADEPALILDAAERAVRYLVGRSDRAVVPTDEAIAELERFDRDLPEGGTDPATTLDLLDRIGSPATMVSNGPRYFGFVTGGSLPSTMAASLLAGSWDQNAGLPVMSPVASQLDRVAARWVVELLGLPDTATASFCGGASVANLTCLVAARDAVLAQAGWDVPEEGLIGAPPVTVVIGDEAHASMVKAVAVAGLGRNRMIRIPADGQGRMRTEAVPDFDGPTIVLLQAGNVNTGASDSFEAVPRWRSAGAWVHVDGAFGAWAAASPDRAPLVRGIDAADSWATDAHKWLNVPYDAGVAIVADGNDLARSMRADASYLVDDALAPAHRVPMHLGLQMSQQARGIAVWAAIHTLGRRGIADLVERSCAHARRFATRLEGAGAVIANDVVLNQVLVSFGDDRATAAVIAAIESDGTMWAGGTTWRGRRHLRLSVSGWETTDDDVDACIDALLACWERAER